MQTMQAALTVQVRKSFEQLDKDGDGFITAEDLVKVSVMLTGPVTYALLHLRWTTPA